MAALFPSALAAPSATRGEVRPQAHFPAAVAPVPVNVREAEYVLGPADRMEPTTHHVGYVEVFAVAPGCFPVSVGGLFTRRLTGGLYFLFLDDPMPRPLPEALRVLRERSRANFDLKPMPVEMVALIAGAGGVQ